MIKGKNIICFGSENWGYPGFQQTIMRKLASDNRIIYINSMGTRKIRLQLSQFMFYLSKIKATFKKRHNAGENCLVCYPKIIPLVYNNFITHINKVLIGLQVQKLLSKQNFCPYILWIGTPTAACVLDLFDPEMIVYHAVDRYSKFSFVNSNKIRIYESQIAKRADVIICTADAIKNDLIEFNDATYTVSHAVDFEHFQSALKNDTIPEDLKTIPKPVIGYFGGLSDRVNLSLIRKTAQRYKNANIVLIGRKSCNLRVIENLPNIHRLGHRSYEQLPAYLKQFDVCLIPYLVNDLMAGVDPIKLREYLCLGKPVVSTKLPEVVKLEPHIYVGQDDEDFVIKVAMALNENDISIEKKRMEVAKQSNWQSKLEEMSAIIGEALLKLKIPGHELN